VMTPVGDQEGSLFKIAIGYVKKFFEMGEAGGFSTERQVLMRDLGRVPHLARHLNA